MTPQLVLGILRGGIITALVAISTFGAGYGTGADSRTIVSTVIAASVPVALGFLGYAGYDANRAKQVAKFNAKALRKSDVGYHRALASIEAHNTAAKAAALRK